MYLILSSQQGARHGIIGDRAQAAAAQEIFVDNLEDVINKEVFLEDDIARFQNVLKYARSKLDYSVGRGLYKIPSNMLLKPLNQVIVNCRKHKWSRAREVCTHVKACDTHVEGTHIRGPFYRFMTTCDNTSFTHT